MKPENKAVFEECRPYYNMVANGLEPQGMSYHQRLNLEAAIAEEFHTGYSSNKDCPACIKEMIKLAYFYYDNYKP